MLPQGSEEGGIRRFILRRVLRNVRCGACGAHYGAEDVAIVESESNIWVLMAVCPGCDTQAMIVVVVQNESARQEEALEVLAKDDVLDFHDFIKQFNGDFRDMLGVD